MSKAPRKLRRCLVADYMRRLKPHFKGVIYFYYHYFYVDKESGPVLLQNEG
ncbi:hypothetical protein RHODOSMS8_02761 [Rhodobiaceae bacterium]|nr:hypothetical protein RHODOSMS8_02761 [Rhodobiaceae bacterium]